MRRWFFWSGLLVVAVVAFWLGADTLRLLAVACGLPALLRLKDLWLAGPHQRVPAPVYQWAAVLLLGLVVLILYGRLLLGDLPVNHDHPVFLFRAWNTGQLLAAGSWFGYSPYQFIGYPANQLYPIGADLLVCLVRALSAGLLGWQAACAVALFIFILARTLAYWALGRQLLGGWAGLAAGLLSLADRGAWMQGGWSFDLDWGVWSMGMSFALCLWALWALHNLLHRPGRLGPLPLALLLAGSILCHPMALVVLGIGLPLLLIVEMITTDPGPPVHWLPRTVAAAGLGLALSAFWLIPFLAHRDWFEPLAARWLAYPEMIRGLWAGNLLRDLSPLLLAGGLAGLLWAAARRRTLAIYLLLLVGLMLALSSSDVLLSLDLLEKFPALANLQLERFAYPVRAALLLGCGLLVELLLQTAGVFSRLRHSGRGRLLALRLLAGAILAPLLVFAPRVGVLPFLAPAQPLQWSSQSPRWRELEQAAAFLKSGQAGPAGRVAVRAGQHDHLLLALPALAGLPVFKIGFTPENNYRYKFTSSDPEVWRAAGVSHLLSVGPWPRPGLVELRRFGGLVLYRFADFSPAPAWLEGPGRLRILEQRPELLRLQIEGTQPDSRLYVRRARYGLWRASSDGRPVEITGASVGDSPAVFMSLAARDGELVIEFTAGAGEWLGGLASLLGLLAALLLLVNGLRPSWLGGLPSRLAPLARPLRAGTTLATLALVLLLSIYLIVRLLLPAPPDFSGRRVVADLSRQLAGASAEVVRPGGKSPCQPFDGRRIKCPGPEWNYAGRTIIGADHLLRQCVWLHPIQGAEFVLHFDGVELGDRLEGFFGMDDAVVEPPSSHDVQFTVYLDGQRLEQLDCPSRRGWFHWRVDTPGRRGSRGRVSVSSAARFTGRRHFCFTAYTTAGGT